MSLFENAADTPYRNRDALKDKYVPDTIVGREAEKREYANALTPVLNGFSPDNVFLIGPSGTGKTALTQHVLDDLKSQQEKNGDGPLTVARINCDGMEGETTLMLEIANEFRDPDDLLATTGYKKTRARDLMFQEFNELGGTILLVLDEIDTIDELDTFMYQVPRAHEVGKISDDVDVGVIGISNDPRFLDDLPADVQNTLTDVTIHFSEYDAEELRDVLAHRAELAFKNTEVKSTPQGLEVDSESLEDEVVPLASAFATKNTGDARMGISLLRNAGDLARDQGQTLVTEDHIRDALELYQSEKVTESVERLERTAKVILYALVTLVAERRDGDDPLPRTNAVGQRYIQFCDQLGADPVSGRQVRKHLAKLENIGMVEGRKQRGGGSGTYTEWALVYKPSVVISSIPGIVEDIPVDGVRDLVLDGPQVSSD